MKHFFYTTTAVDKTGTTLKEASMIPLRLCWPTFALWYMCQGTKSHLVSKQINDRIIEIVSGVRYVSAEQTSPAARSVMECALKCVNEKSCSRFNFCSGQCELLLGKTSCRTNASQWSHGYDLTGKYKKWYHLSWKMVQLHTCYPCNKILLFTIFQRER